STICLCSIWLVEGCGPCQTLTGSVCAIASPYFVVHHSTKAERFASSLRGKIDAHLATIVVEFRSYSVFSNYVGCSIGLEIENVIHRTRCSIQHQFIFSFEIIPL